VTHSDGVVAIAKKHVFTSQAIATLVKLKAYY